jgi:hypothetical protein
MVLDIQTVHHILFDFPFKNNFVFQEYLQSFMKYLMLNTAKQGVLKTKTSKDKTPPKTLRPTKLEN